MRERIYLWLWLCSAAIERRCWAWAVRQNCVGEWVRVSQERSARVNDREP